MKKLIVKDLVGSELVSWELPDELLEAQVLAVKTTPAYGRHERWVSEEDPVEYAPEEILASEERIVQFGHPEVMDDAGVVMHPALPEIKKMFYKLRADYVLEIVDISSDHAMKECIGKRKAEYPTPEEFMNAYFDGGPEALGVLHMKRLEIKAKYPKPGV